DFFCRVRPAAMVVSVVSSGAVHCEVRRPPWLSGWAWVRAVVSWPARPLRPTVGRTAATHYWPLATILPPLATTWPPLPARHQPTRQNRVCLLDSALLRHKSRFGND